MVAAARPPVRIAKGETLALVGLPYAGPKYSRTAVGGQHQSVALGWPARVSP